MTVRRLTLTNFRNYHAASLETDAKTIVLVGPNGAGKTNLIEAISFFTPGRGLRRATLDEVAFSEGDGSWAVAAEIEGALGLATLGTGIERPIEEGATTLRKYRIDREPVASPAAFADHVRVVWLIPAMDALFTGAPSERRRFLDRLVLAVDPEHGSRVNALERSLRSRNRLLEDPRPDPHWLDAVEHETAELAVAVAGLRVETMQRLAVGLSNRKGSPFPAAEIALDGWMEQLIPDHPAAEIEERYRAVLRDNRAQDAAAGRTLDGPHLTDLKVFYADKGILGGRHVDRRTKGAVDRARAGSRQIDCGDDRHRADSVARRDCRTSRSGAAQRSLHAELAQLDSQVWMTGADPALFAEIDGSAEVVEVSSGRLHPKTRKP